MPWTKSDHPDSMKGLEPDVREKAIEIANTLVEDEGRAEGRAIAIAQAQARRAVKGDGATTGEHQDRGGSDDLHLVPHEDGWAVRSAGADQAERTFETKKEAREWAQDTASDRGVDLVLHKEDGSVQEKWDLNRAEE